MNEKRRNFMKTIIYNGTIYIELGKFVSAILIEDDKIIKTGSDKEILALEDELTVKIDAKGNSVLPGFHDSHMHLYNVGATLNCVPLYGVTSIEEVIWISKEFIKTHQPEKNTFVLGRGWNQDYFEKEKRILTKDDLDQISTEYPILLTRACGHMAVCNSKALEICNITKDTPQVAGAEFYLDEQGNPNGIFTEESIRLIKDQIPIATKEEMKRTIQTAMEYGLSQGITSVQTNDMENSNYQELHQAYDEVLTGENPKLRVYHQCFFQEPKTYEKFLQEGYHTGKGNDYHKIGPLKMFIDGSLGARTAYMRKPYQDDKTTWGIACMTQEQLNEMIQLADRYQCQVAVHAIGDKAIEMVLDGYETVIKNGENPKRHGVVHCQITDEALVQRFVENQILAYVQPIFLHYDMHIVEERVGEALASTSYAFGDLYRKGIAVSYGTDAPVENLKTMDNLYCAVTRKDLNANPSDGFYPQQRVSLEEAIDLYTSKSAFASFDEHKKGKLKEGYLADLVILDQNIFKIDIETIRETNVLLTMVGGIVAYKKDKGDF